MNGVLVRHIKDREDGTGNIIEVKMWRVNPRLISRTAINILLFTL